MRLKRISAGSLTLTSVLLWSSFNSLGALGAVISASDLKSSTANLDAQALKDKTERYESYVKIYSFEATQAQNLLKPAIVKRYGKSRVMTLAASATKIANYKKHLLEKIEGARTLVKQELDPSQLMDSALISGINSFLDSAAEQVRNNHFKDSADSLNAKKDFIINVLGKSKS